MFDRISDRDKRTLKFGAVAVVIILGWMFATPWLDEWKSTRAMLKAKREQLKVIAPESDSKAAQAAEQLAQAVPVFEMPTLEKKQAPLFRDKFNEQLKRAGINVKTFQPIGKSAKRMPGEKVKLLRFQCRGKCSLDQVLNLLADLNSNPWLAGIDEFTIKCDQKDRRKMDLVMTVTTFVK